MQSLRQRSHKALVRHKVTFGPLPPTFKPATKLDFEPRKAEPWAPEGPDKLRYSISVDEFCEGLKQLEARHRWAHENGYDNY